MITGGQIRQARGLLSWSASQLARAAGVREQAIERAERTEGEPAITLAHALAIRTRLEAAGIEFLDRQTPTVRLRR